MVSIICHIWATLVLFW